MEDGRVLTVHLLGGFHITSGHDKVTGLDQARVQRLLAYLLLHRRAPHSRQQIAFTLWPDTSDAQALTNLRTLLTRLRQALPDADRFLEIGAHALRWRQDAPYSLDVADFEDACVHAMTAEQRGLPAEAILALEKAVNLYVGDLLPGWYDEWLAPERERLRQIYLDTLERLAALLENRRNFKEALGYTQQLVRADPLHEAVYRQLMNLHMALGERASALRVYHTCATILRHELGVDPSPATQTVYRRVLMVDANPAQQTPPPAVGMAFVGRQVEWQALLHAWRQSATGHAQVVLISGEAGIGKTRLAEELLAWAERQGVDAAVARCYASSGPPLAYGPIVEWLRSATMQARARSLDGIWLSETARLAPELLAGRPDLPAPGPMTEAWQRQRFFQALARAALVPWTDGASKFDTDQTGRFDDGQTLAGSVRPQLLILDDMQWCDQETLDWLQYLMQVANGAPLLILGTVRVEEADHDHPLNVFRLALERHGRLRELRLASLTPVETATLAADLLSRALTPAQAAQLFQDTEGNPLFVVETVRAGIGNGEARTQGDRAAGWIGQAESGHDFLSRRSTLPPKVRAVIQRRLALLSPAAQALVQTAAVIGREFTFDVLASASGQDEASVVQGLDELWRRQIVREQGAAAYDFSHDRIREVAYTQIGAAQRRWLHRRIAEALQSAYESNLDAASAQIAHHYEQAGDPAQAYVWHARASRQAQSANAPETAIWHCNKAIAFLPANAAALDKVQLFKRLGAMQRIRAYFPQAREAYTQMRRAAEEAGDLAAQVDAWIGLAQVQDSEADHGGSLQSAQQAERLASTIGAAAEAELAIALSIQGLAYYRLGMAENALRLGEAALAVSDALGPEGRWQQARSLNLLGAIHTMLGNHDRAWADREQALALFREVGDQVWIGHILNNLGEIARHRGDYLAALPFYQEALTIAERIGNLEGEAVYRCNLGGALVRLGHHEAAATELREALAVSETGYWVSESYSFLAEALVRQGRAEEALRSGLAALESGRQTNALDPLGVAWRVMGMITAQRGEPATIDGTVWDPVACFSESERILAAIGAETERRHTLLEWAEYNASQGIE